MSESELISADDKGTIIVWNKDQDGVFVIKAEITCEDVITAIKKIDIKSFLSGHGYGAVCLWQQTEESKYSLINQIGEHKGLITSIEWTTNNEFVIGSIVFDQEK